MSAKDMCQLPNLKEILELGIKSLKIEGRMKTEHYIATVNQVYSNAINEIYEHGSLSNEKLNVLRKSVSYYLEALDNDKNNY